ncbi:unnamed protein product [Xylocopa violacea]|uniref:RNA exonuclease 4 n=2 Tax=Xylocopa violacea TaxID=135666 RepID=A0ABP1NZH7_XYLVO
MFYFYFNISISVFFTVCYVALILYVRKHEERQRQCHCKESAIIETMEKKDIQTTQRTVSHTECNVPAHNCEMRHEQQQKQCNSKKSPTKETMERNDKQTIQHMVPYTERNMSGRNCEIKHEEQRKQCHSKKSTSKETIERKDKQTAQRLVPHTERNVSGHNWEMFKNSVINTPPLHSDNNVKENLMKKTAPHKKSKKKNHLTTLIADHVTPLNEEVIYDENKKKLTKHIALDCEMVGIGDGTESMLARVSIVNRHGFCIYDKYVKPREPVKDYRTKVSGIEPHHLQNGEEFDIVQKEVAEILKGRVLIGHGLKHDLDVLYLSHPRKHLRDTSKFKTFRQLSRGNTPGLKKLAQELLGREIQTGEHNSIEDARSTMQLYMLYKNKWESECYSKR